MLDVRGAPKVTDADLGNGAADPGATIKPEIDLSKHFQNTTPSTDTMSYSVDSEPKGISATINGDQLATIQVDNNVVPADYAINIHAKNNHSGDYSGDAIYHLTVNKPATLTCPEPDTQFHYDQQYCAQHPDGKVDYYGESGGYKFELAPYFIVYHCDTIPKPGELKFFSAYITRNSPGPTLVCRYNFSGSETDWYTVKRLPANSNFHNYATQDDCGSLSDHKTIEECKVDLKG